MAARHYEREKPVITDHVHLRKLGSAGVGSWLLAVDPGAREEREREAEELSVVRDGRRQLVPQFPGRRSELETFEACLLVRQQRAEKCMSSMGFQFLENITGVDRLSGGQQKVNVEVREEIAVFESSSGGVEHGGAFSELFLDHAGELLGLGERERDGVASVVVDAVV